MITIYTKDYCPYCVQAKNLFTSLGVSFSEIDLSHDQKLFDEIKEKSGMMTVPQIFFGETCLGGFSDVYALHREGKLMSIIQSEITEEVIPMKIAS